MNYLKNIFSNLQNIWSLPVRKNLAMASCSDNSGQLEEVSTLDEQKAYHNNLNNNPAKRLNKNIPALITDNRKEDFFNEHNREMVGDTILKLKENTNSMDIIEQIKQNINVDYKIQMQSFECNEINNFETNNKCLNNKNGEMEQISFNVIYNKVEDDSYKDLDEFHQSKNYNSNTHEVSDTINMALDESIDIKYKKQDEASDNDLNTANCSLKNATRISNNDFLAVVKDLTEGKNILMDETNLYKNEIKESDVIVGNINLSDNSQINNYLENCIENTMNMLSYETEYTRSNKNVKLIDNNNLSENLDQDLTDKDLFQDIVLDVETCTFLTRAKELYENKTNKNSTIESLSTISTIEITDIQELKTTCSLPGENSDYYKSSKVASDDNSESLLQTKVDEETVNNNNIDELLSGNLESNLDFFTIIISSDEESDISTVHKISKSSKKAVEIDTIGVNSTVIQNAINKHSSTTTNRKYNFKSTTENNSRFATIYNKDSLRHVRRNFNNINYTKTEAKEAARLRQYRFQPIKDVLAAKDHGDYKLNILDRKNKSSQVIKNRININSYIRPREFENIKYICDINNIIINTRISTINIKKPIKKVLLNNIDSSTIKAIVTANSSLNRNENKDDIGSESFNNMTAKYSIETKIANNMIHPLADNNKLESYSQGNLYDSNMISTLEYIDKEHIVTPKLNQYSKSIKDNTNAEHDAKNEIHQRKGLNKHIFQNNLDTYSASTSRPVRNTINNNTISSGQNISKICISSTKTLGHRDIKNATNDTDSDYNSSDFEFISENDAKTDLLLDKTIDNRQYDISKIWNRNAYVHRLRKAKNKYPGPTNYQKKHAIPRGDAYLRLFKENEYHPVLSNIHMMENKSIRSSRSNDQYRGVGFDMRLTSRENSDDERKGKAKATMKKICSMYPADNKKRKR